MALVSWFNRTLVEGLQYANQHRRGGGGNYNCKVKKV
jgi:hypothetical protein